MYEVIHYFPDKEHRYNYKVGDAYPAEGLKTTPERVAFLMGDKNAIGVPLLKKVEGKPQKPE